MHHQDSIARYRNGIPKAGTAGAITGQQLLLLRPVAAVADENIGAAGIGAGSSIVRESTTSSTAHRRNRECETVARCAVGGQELLLWNPIAAAADKDVCTARR